MLETCRKYGISDATCSKRRSGYGGIESTVGKNPALLDYEQNDFWNGTTLEGEHGVSYFDGEMHDPYMSRRGDTYETIRGNPKENTSTFDKNVGGWYFVIPEEED